jgi:deoxyribodipyrimidine photolyase-related protein
MKSLFLSFGNQLFHPQYLARFRQAHIILVEDEHFCGKYAYHKQKLVFVLAAMRNYAQLLRDHGFQVSHFTLDDQQNWRSAVTTIAAETGAGTLCHFELESPDLTAAIERFARRQNLQLEVVQTPMFLNTLGDFSDHLAEHKSPKLLPFYRQQRTRRKILMTPEGQPIGGRWSYDQENRAKLPRGLQPEEPPMLIQPASVAAAKRLVEERYACNPGRLEHFWLPTTHTGAEEWLEEFLATRFWNFGTYEDALTERSPFVYHSGLAPLLNVGLLTPEQVVNRALEYAGTNNVPVNSLEGFIRQIIGWREFVRGVFHHYYEPMQSRNIWNADRQLTDAWYTGRTGIAPLDHVIRKTLKLGWAHHIERLMVAANLMNLSGIQPQEVYRWFMEMYVDAYDWVMVPNVFGMGLTSEGGIFTTKPYICGSNYVLKMGDFKRGEWCDVMDGLLWRFVANHEQTLRTNHRLAPMIANLGRVVRKRPEIFTLADRFIEEHTQAA